MEPLDELYFIWLHGQVSDLRDLNPSRTHLQLLRKLYTTEFVWLIPNDDNRLEDGKFLRRQFLREENIHDVDRQWMELGCSVLELMVGLAQRLSFEADEGEPHYWFWKLMENIGLRSYTDDFELPEDEVDSVLDRVIWRQYRRNGDGGFFPLKGRCRDQRKVELWYQMSAYVLENELVA
ncbi:hypothetical protein SEA_ROSAASANTEWAA_38 [Streptomyces phage RosaAsantewaa]|nr:hypothetical protein SEA_ROSAASANTEWAA_38 [Streptomyces phage RosaAsantewaa]